MHKQPLSGLREYESIRAAIEQLAVQTPLEFGHSPAYGRVVGAQLPGGRRKPTLAR